VVGRLLYVRGGGETRGAARGDALAVEMSGDVALSEIYKRRDPLRAVWRTENGSKRLSLSNEWRVSAPPVEALESRSPIQCVASRVPASGKSREGASASDKCEWRKPPDPGRPRASRRWIMGLAILGLLVSDTTRASVIVNVLVSVLRGPSARQAANSSSASSPFHAFERLSSKSGVLVRLGLPYRDKYDSTENESTRCPIAAPYRHLTVKSPSFIVSSTVPSARQHLARAPRISFI
jgi:hypothetical protein